jgi:polar amino acid transport system substrate-binding protein
MHYFIVMIGAAVMAFSSFGALAAEVREVLAPQGKLRVGVYLGSPTSMVHDKTGETHGLSFDLGKELANRLNVPFEQVNYQRISDVLEGMKAGEVDFTVSNSTPARAASVTFSQTLLTIELGYLVTATSPIASIADVQKPGIRVGVTQGSTSQGTIPKLLPNATVVPAQNFKRGIEMLERGEIDTYATNKPTLFDMSDQMKGAHVLDGRWGEEHLAIAIPKGREAALDYVSRFVEEVQVNGLLARTVERAGVRGALKAQ